MHVLGRRGRQRRASIRQARWQQPRCFGSGLCFHGSKTEQSRLAKAGVGTGRMQFVWRQQPDSGWKWRVRDLIPTPLSANRVLGAEGRQSERAGRGSSGGQMVQKGRNKMCLDGLCVWMGGLIVLGFVVCSVLCRCGVVDGFLRFQLPISLSLSFFFLSFWTYLAGELTLKAARAEDGVV